MLAQIKEHKREIRGPSLTEFFKGANIFPAFHFYELMKKYGDVIRCGPHFYVINHPDIARDILNRDQKDFSQLDFIGQRVTTIFGYGMVTSQGKLWASQRRIVNPVLNHKSVHKLMSEAIDQIDSSLDSWEEHIDSKSPVDLVDLTGTLALMTSGKLLYHFDLSDHIAEIKNIVATGTEYLAEGLPFYLPLWVPSPKHSKIKKDSRKIDEILEQVLAASQKRGSNNEDMASVLIKALGTKTASDYQKRVMLDEMKTMLAGGYFPVSCSLSMIWYALGKFPEYFDKMKKEIVSKPKDYQFYHDFYQDFPTTSAIIFEVMRLYPVAFSIWRKAKNDFETGGYLIPKGKSICISIFNVHRHPNIWEDPDVFNPERFMNSKGNKRPKHHFMPFGWGSKKCIGDHYAIMVIFLTLIRAIQRYDIQVIDKPLEVRKAALLCPKKIMAEIGINK